MSKPSVVVSTRGEERIHSGHPWIYRTDVGEIHASAGDVVVVRNGRGRVLGEAIYSDRSQITIRMLTSGEQPADEALIRRRIEVAIGFRDQLKLDASAYRLVHGEADLLP
jgi:23S rRNA (cytosine1962-C5)-methyltransferase